MHRLPLQVLATFVCAVAATGAHAQHLIAHRGASHDAPENTLAAFRLAWQRGADGIEGDFQLTADGEIVCLHDKDTKRVAGKKLVAGKSTMAELQSLDVGSWKGEQFRGERPPSLREVIETIPEGKWFFLEIKCGPEIVKPLKSVLAESPLAAEQVILISFNEEVIRACGDHLPKHRTQWLTSFREEYSGWSPDAASVVDTLRRSGASGLGCKAERRCVDARFLATLADAGFPRLGVWTVNDLATARYFRSAGVWAITTDRPGWLRERLDDE